MKYLITILFTLVAFTSCSTEHLQYNEADVTFKVENNVVRAEGLASIVTIQEIHKSNINFNGDTILLFRDIQLESGETYRAYIHENGKYVLSRIR